MLSSVCACACVRLCVRVSLSGMRPNNGTEILYYFLFYFLFLFSDMRPNNGTEILPYESREGQAKFCKRELDCHFTQ